jgi:hypothetical protein
MEASTEYYDHDSVQSLAEFFGELAASWMLSAMEWVRRRQVVGFS